MGARLKINGWLVGSVACFLLAFCAIAVWAASTLFYWGPLDPPRDHAKEMMDIAFAETGRDPSGNAEDWARWVRLLQEIEGVEDELMQTRDWPTSTRFRDPIPPDVSIHGLFPAEPWDTEDREVSQEFMIELAQQVIERYDEIGAFDRLDELLAAADRDGYPIVPLEQSARLQGPDSAAMDAVRKLVSITNAAAMLALMDGDYSDAIAMLERSYGLLRMLGQQSWVIQRLISGSYQTLSDEILRAILLSNPEDVGVVRRLEAIHRSPTRSVESVLTTENISARSIFANKLDPRSPLASRNMTYGMRLHDRLQERSVDFVLGRMSVSEVSEYETQILETLPKLIRIPVFQGFGDTRDLGLLDPRTLLDSMAGFFYRYASEARIMPIFFAIERFRREHGTPPDTLSALIPDYLDAIPTGDPRRIAPLPDIIYERIAEAPGYRLAVPIAPLDIPRFSISEQDDVPLELRVFVPVPNRLPATPDAP